MIFFTFFLSFFAEIQAKNVSKFGTQRRDRLKIVETTPIMIPVSTVPEKAVEKTSNAPSHRFFCFTALSKGAPDATSRCQRRTESNVMLPICELFANWLTFGSLSVIMICE